MEPLQGSRQVRQGSAAKVLRTAPRVTFTPTCGTAESCWAPMIRFTWPYLMLGVPSRACHSRCEALAELTLIFMRAVEHFQLRARGAFGRFLQTLRNSSIWDHTFALARRHSTSPCTLTPDPERSI